MDSASGKSKHSLLEDAQAIVIATTLIALALNMYAKCQCVTGGAAGLALLAHYVTSLSIGSCFFLVSLPFYYLGYRQLGGRFILRTFISICCLSLMIDQVNSWVQFEKLDPLFTSILGGGLIGVGFLLIFRHGASLGGINILVLYWQARYKLNVGKTQMLIDSLIILCSIWVVPASAVAYSLIGCAMVNLVMLMNFRSERYMGYSR